MSTRHLVLAFLSLLTAASFGQAYQRPKTVLGMKWGASRGEVLKAFTDAGAMVPEGLYDSTEPKIQCTGGKFAGQEVVSWEAELVRGQLVGLSVTLKAFDNGGALYREIKKELTRKYGPPTGERKLSTLTADQKRNLQLNGARIPNQGAATSWKFMPNLQEKDTLTLSCESAPPPGSATEDESQFLVTVRYTSESMKAQLSSSAESSGRPLVGKDL